LGQGQVADIVLAGVLWPTASRAAGLLLYHPAPTDLAAPPRTVQLSRARIRPATDPV